MNLDTVQNKFVLSKQLGYSLLKGKSSTGKTASVVHRAVYLKNQYCLYEDDKILVITDNAFNRNLARNIYENIDEKNKIQYITLFTNNEDKIDFYSLEEIVDLSFKTSTKHDFKIIDEEDKKTIVQLCLEQIKLQFEDIKILNNNYTNFFISEIKWIKCRMINSLEKYQNADRKGRKVKKEQGPSRLLKNSKSREAIFQLMLLYNKTLEDYKLIDQEDKERVSLSISSCNKYTHIIIDEFQNFTKLQFEIARSLLNNKDYSSVVLVNNLSRAVNSNLWFNKSSFVDTNENRIRLKTYLLKNSYEEKEKVIEFTDKYKNEDNKNGAFEMFMESFEYYDIRHGRKHSFIRDCNEISEVIVKSEENDTEYSIDELNELPVFSDIAAGEPIMINPDIEDKFYLPKYWLKGFNDCFILKVKGDSMINANIDDGDYVVIRKQHAAQNKDIVAVEIDGSATLKRLSIDKDEIKLVPENSKYRPIYITEDGASIIGTAVGIIKAKL